MLTTDDEGYDVYGSAPHQVAHAVPPLQPPCIPQAEAECVRILTSLRVVWLPLGEDPQLSVGPEGYPPQDYWHWPYALPQDRSSPCQEWLPHWHAEEGRCCCISIHSIRHGLLALCSASKLSVPGRTFGTSIPGPVAIDWMSKNGT